MFIKDDEGTLRLDYNQVDKIHKYGLIMKDGRELILPQSLIQKIKVRLTEYYSWERGIDGSIIR